MASVDEEIILHNQLNSLAQEYHDELQKVRASRQNSKAKEIADDISRADDRMQQILERIYHYVRYQFNIFRTNRSHYIKKAWRLWRLSPFNQKRKKKSKFMLIRKTYNLGT